MFRQPLRNTQHVSYVVGDFYEEATACLLGGERLAAHLRGAGNNPDVEVDGAREVESKAVGTGNSVLVEQEQLRRLERAPGAVYAVWWYVKPNKGKRGLRHYCATIEELVKYLRCSTDQVVVLPARVVGELCTLCGTWEWNGRKGFRLPRQKILGWLEGVASVPDVRVVSEGPYTDIVARGKKLSPVRGIVTFGTEEVEQVPF